MGGGDVVAPMASDAAREGVDAEVGFIVEVEEVESVDTERVRTSAEDLGAGIRAPKHRGERGVLEENGRGDGRS